MACSGWSKTVRAARCHPDPAAQRPQNSVICFAPPPGLRRIPGPLRHDGGAAAAVVPHRRLPPSPPEPSIAASRCLSSTSLDPSPGCDVIVQSLIEEEGFQFISKRARGGSQALGSCLDIVEVFSTTSRSADLHARYQFTKTMYICSARKLDIKNTSKFWGKERSHQLPSSSTWTRQGLIDVMI